MSALKVIVGLVCLVASFFLGLFAWASLYCPELWFKFIPAGFTLGLVFVGILLVSRRNSPLSNSVKWIMGGYFCLLVMLPVLLDFHIRQERRPLQERAKAFLAHPIPKLLIPDSEGYVGGYYVDTNGGTANGVFGYSRVLIGRYATKGRIFGRVNDVTLHVVHANLSPDIVLELVQILKWVVCHIFCLSYRFSPNVVNILRKVIKIVAPR